MLKTPSPLQSRGSPPGGGVQEPPGAGSSPAFRWNLRRMSASAPASFHLKPESWTAMTTSERPVDRRHAVSTCMPLTPKSSFALRLISGSVVQKFVLAYFHLLSLQLPAAPVISFGSGMQPSGLPEVSQRFGFARKGNSARAGVTAATSAANTTTSDFLRMGGLPLRSRADAARGIRYIPGRGLVPSTPEPGI